MRRWLWFGQLAVLIGVGVLVGSIGAQEAAVPAAGGYGGAGAAAAPGAAPGAIPLSGAPTVTGQPPDPNYGLAVVRPPAIPPLPNWGEVPPPPFPRQPVKQFFRGFNLCCWSSPNCPGCGSLKAECTYIFGSCQAYYNERCAAGPFPLTQVAGYPPWDYPSWYENAGPGAAAGYDYGAASSCGCR